MWIVCITSVRHVLTVNGYGGRQTKENEKSWCFKGWETLVGNYSLQVCFLISLNKFVKTKMQLDFLPLDLSHRHLYQGYPLYHFVHGIHPP